MTRACPDRLPRARMFNRHFTLADASPILLGQQQLLLAALDEALAVHPPENPVLTDIFASNRASLAADAAQIHRGTFIHLLQYHTLSRLAAGDVPAALAWGRSAYIVSRRFAHGWLPFLNVLIAGAIFEPIGVDPAPESLIKAASPAIPRRIVQYWDKPSPPEDVARMIATWQAERGYFHRLFDNAQARRFLDMHFGPRVLAAYDTASHVAGKADIFRLAWLYQRGGIYADADERLAGRLDSILPAGSRLVLTWASGEPPCIQNGFIAASPMHPFIAAALMLAIKRIEYAASARLALNAWIQSGPGVFSMVLLDDFAIHGRPSVASGLRLMPDLEHRRVVQSDEFLQYRNDPAGNWRLQPLN